MLKAIFSTIIVVLIFLAGMNYAINNPALAKGIIASLNQLIRTNK
jgi:hypothetical protein